DESRITITNGTVNVAGQFGFSTDGLLFFYIDNGSLHAGSIVLNAGNFITDTVNPAPVSLGTAFADKQHNTTGGDFTAEANWENTNTFVVDSPGLIHVNNIHDDNGIGFSAGGSI